MDQAEYQRIKKDIS
ncbi:MAG: hypothetical protein ACYCSZ_12230 [Burkholderiales bacterium]